MLSTVLSALLALLWTSQCVAILVNVTVDDTNATAWTWTGSWNAITQQNPCTVCFAQPDGSRTHNYSWHDGSLLSGSFTFQGVAVYIYGIDVPNPANITFSMSSPPVSAFHYKDTGGGYIYDSLFFSADGLDGTSPRTVTWNEEGNSIGGGGGGLFDYALVTVDQSATPSTSSSTSFPSATNSGGLTRKSKTGPIAGGVVGALAFLVILAAVLYYCLRRRNRSPSKSPVSIQQIDDDNKQTGATSRTPVSNLGYFVEPFQVPQSSGTTSSPAASTIPPSVPSSSQNPKEQHTILGWTPSPITPPVAHARDAGVGQRPRNLEATVAEEEPPPAYA
ncbi:hypothetical protein C8F01DRAFT_1128448 [Mycena amicta]|nr:hypothetical protein C8F01DRAFT_1128448 [Mycena amicta]